MILAAMKPKGLRERLADGESIICTEGYVWELERRGYVRSGAYIPEVVLDHPERVIGLHEEFVHAGSDVVEAFTYFGHREKMKLIGREEDVQQLNLKALKIAKKVALDHGCLMAGNVSNTTSYNPDDPENIERVKSIFKEHVEWAVKGEADFIIGETFDDLGEAKLALQAIQTYGQGLPAVITIACYHYDYTTDDVPIPQALRQLEEMGADVVGVNCGWGPESMLPLLRKCREVCKGPLAALPAPFRTTDKERTFYGLTDPKTGKSAFPLDLDCLRSSRSDIRAFARAARDLGVQYVGLCCGNSANLLREIAVEYGRQPPAMKYAPAPEKSNVLSNIHPRAAKIYTRMIGTSPDAPPV